MMNALKQWLCYWTLGHNWTCAAEQGVLPTEKQLADGIDGFFDYSTMYCKDCGHVSELSKRRSV